MLKILILFVQIKFRGTYSDNREIEGRIFHLAKEFCVPLFEKDPLVEKNIQNLYRVGFFDFYQNNRFLFLEF